MRFARKRFVALLAAAVLLLAAAGFVWAHLGSPATPPGSPLAIVTEPAPDNSGACLLALLSGAEMRRSGGRVLFAQGDHEVAITWPYGTTARLVDGKAELFGPNGDLIGTEGQRLPDLTGGLGIDDRFHVCAIGR